MANILLAAFSSKEDADRAVDELESSGYRTTDISIISQERNRRVRTATDDLVEEGAASGAATGGVIGGVAGLLAGAGVFPALAGLLIGGPIVAVLGATGVIATTVSGAVTGAVAGGLIGALASIGIPEDAARYYDVTVTRGGVILAVPIREGDKVEPRSILEAHRAEHIRELTLPA